MESSRRQRAQSDLGLNFEREDFRREAALAKEQERVAKKEAKREKMMNRSSYRIMVKTAKYMDKYYLDPLIGLIPGGVGDVLSSSLAMPFIYYSLCVVRSIPLTLAVIYNVLLDVLKRSHSLCRQRAGYIQAVVFGQPEVDHGLYRRRQGDHQQSEKESFGHGCAHRHCMRIALPCRETGPHGGHLVLIVLTTIQMLHRKSRKRCSIFFPLFLLFFSAVTRFGMADR